MELKTSEVLYLAADEIDRRGWRQGPGWNYSGMEHVALCLEGGIMAALGMTSPSSGMTIYLLDVLCQCSAYRAVADLLGLNAPLHARRPKVGEQPLWKWNDQYGRTKEQVTEALRAAAFAESKKEQMLEVAR